MTTVNLEQTAALLGAHPETVRLEAKAGELPGRKVGKRWMFSTGTPALTLRRSRLSVGPRSSCTRPSMETRHRTRCMGDYMTPSEPLRLPSVRYPFPHSVRRRSGPVWGGWGVRRMR